MKKALLIPLLIILQIIYFFAYIKFEGSGNYLGGKFNFLFFMFWIVILSVNTYLLYNLFPLMKNYVKSKNILCEVLYFIVCLLISALITNGPTELIVSSFV